MPSVHWRRLDLPGRDHAELTSTPGGHRLVGGAHFHDTDGLIAITYFVTLAPDWTTQSAALRVMDRAGRRRLTIASNSTGTWTVQGRPMPAVSGCVDLDLAFTPATNLISVRRLALAVGASADVTAAWFDLRAKTLAPLRQTYHRISASEYAYSCPALGFNATLHVDENGFVRRYPPLWEEA
jgi:uncharacterized protein